MTNEILKLMSDQLVLCPKCGADGRFEIVEPTTAVNIKQIRTVCTGCGHASTNLFNNKSNALRLLDDWMRGESQWRVEPTDARLTILSFGAGQDSTTLLYLYAYSEEFRQKYAPGRFKVVMSDVGNEHPQTLDHIKYIEGFCKKKGIDFTFLTPDMGFHSPKWQSLKGQYRLNNTVGSKAFMKTCTDRLKLQPIYGYLDHWLGQEYGLKSGRKNAFKEFAEQYGKIDMLIGIAAGEEKRCANAGSDPKKWRAASVRTVYPLVEMGLDRQGCHEVIKGFSHEIPMPSNCMICPFLSEQELVYLHRFHNEDYQEWVELEANKIKKFADKGDQNFGVWGKKLLPQVLAESLKKYGDWTDAMLMDYKMSHGHCVMSTY